MKFHHLARHNNGAQFVGSHQHQQREMSPIKQQQIASSLHNNNNNNNNNLTDDEDDDFNEDQPVNFYEALIGEHQSSQTAPATTTAAPTATNHQPEANQQQQQQQTLDSNGFLIDKNKKLFPQKLWELIHNPSIQHCLRWSQDGQRVYLNRNEFETYYLKTANNQFHTQKAISFVRQMNMYGFRKVDDCYYENDNFRRDQQYLLKNMIRRHPNKGLFVGLDHHQLAAAAAAQQALQVNQQLQQLEHQHKHRAEQALRLNSYLNSHHQFHHQTNLANHHNNNHNNHHHHQHHHLKHSSSFGDLSSQLAQAAVNHLTQQQQQQQQQLLQHQRENTNLIETNQHQTSSSINTSFADHQQTNLLARNNQQQQQQQQQQSSTASHQPKKSRLLGDFYASTASSQNNLNNNNNNNLCANQLASVFGEHQNNNGNNNNNNNQLILSQDSMHSTSSVDTQPSQCSSVVNSGSAGSPQPNSPKNLQHQRKATKLNQANNESNNNNNNNSGKFVVSSNGAQQAANLSSHESLVAAARQAALHQTLVRSLLQLKHGHQQPQDLLSSLQQQQQQQQHHLHHHLNSSRSLLESLASLSSAGTGSIVDPTSNSPTERTATPPSGPPSPSMIHHQHQHHHHHNNHHQHRRHRHEDFDENNDMALDLAKSSSSNNGKKLKRETDEYDAIDIDVSGDEKDDKTDVVEGVVDSPLDGAKKVRKFLEDHVKVGRAQCVKRERPENDEDNDDVNVDVDSACSSPPLAPARKRAKLISGGGGSQCSSGKSSDEDSSELHYSASKSFVASVCERRGDLLNESALNEAARYTECFLDILLEDASLISGHSLKTGELDLSNAGGSDNGTTNGDHHNNDHTKPDGPALIDLPSVSLALKLIPSKLIGTIQRHQQQQQETSRNKSPQMIALNEPTSSCQDI